MKQVIQPIVISPSITPSATQPPAQPPAQPLSPSLSLSLSFLRFSSRILPSGILGTALTLVLTGIVIKPAPAQTAPLNPNLEVGVVQRFGSGQQDVITLKPTTGDRLTLKFNSPDAAGQQQSITTANEVKIAITPQPLSQPQLMERVILSTHRSFESAEDSANYWRSKGIEVEIAQPSQWQVWAKREVYQSPLLRRLLLQNLQSHGAKTAFIDRQMLQQAPRATLIVGNYHYQRDEFEIDTTRDVVEVGFNREEHGKRAYGGTLKLQPNAYGTYTLVNHVPLETYLRGVVPHEIGASAPATTIEAQAILARTYVMRNLRRFTIDHYQICADTQCQVYRGLTGTDPASDRAITATNGMVLTYQNELVDALYSSTTGGVTASFSDVWNGPDRPYLQAVVDSTQTVWDISKQNLADEKNFRAFMNLKQGFNEVGWDMFRWRQNNTLAEVAGDIKSYLRSKQSPLANFTQIKNLEVLERSSSGRVQKMAVTTDRGVITLEKDEILRALYAPNSTLFYVDPIYEPAARSNAAAKKPAATAQGAAQAASAPAVPPANRTLKGFAFVGGGFGHGVGMSQTGAYRLGDLGWANSRILTFYFPGTQVQPLSDAITLWREPQESQ